MMWSRHDALHQFNECIDCEACAPACPVDAIRAEGDLPDRWDKCERVNADYYSKRTADK